MRLLVVIWLERFDDMIVVGHLLGGGRDQVRRVIALADDALGHVYFIQVDLRGTAD